MNVTNLTPPIELSWGIVHTLEVVESDAQQCDFLIAHGIDPKDNEPFTEAVSVNLQPHAFCQHGQFFVRTDNFNHELVKALIDRGILVDTGLSQPSNWIRIPLFVYTPAMEETNADCV